MHRNASQAGVAVITPPTAEPITLAEARAFLRIDVPGFPGDTSQDALIASFITGARQWLEKETDRSIGIQTLMTAASSFYHLGADVNAGYLGYGWESDLFGYRGQYGPSYGIALPRGPIRSVVSIKYLTFDGQDLTVDPTTYRLTQIHPQRVILKNLAAWPAGASLEPESVRITYIAGYGPRGAGSGSANETYADNYADTFTGDLGGVAADPYPCGDDIIAAMRLMLGHFWLNRSATVMTLKAEDLPLGVRALIWPNRASVGI